MSAASDLDAELSKPAARVCLLWRFERSDGVVLGFSDHDAPLQVGGVIYSPTSGLEGGVLNLSADLAPTGGSVAGALSSEALTEEDLSNGLWDRARVDVFRASWRNPDARRLIWSGRLGAVARGDLRFEVELLSLKADLETRFGRLFSKTCDAEIGDARCGVDLSGAAYKSLGVVASIETDAQFTANLSTTAQSGFFVGGRAVFQGNDGPLGEAFITGHGTGTTPSISLDSGVQGITEGDTVTLFAGCDKRLSTCRARFDNVLNFRGFPYLPGDDAMIAGPASSGNDGGSRY